MLKSGYSTSEYMFINSITDNNKGYKFKIDKDFRNMFYDGTIEQKLNFYGLPRLKEYSNIKSNESINNRLKLKGFKSMKKEKLINILKDMTTEEEVPLPKAEITKDIFISTYDIDKITNY